MQCLNIPIIRSQRILWLNRPSRPTIRGRGEFVVKHGQGDRECNVLITLSKVETNVVCMEARRLVEWLRLPGCMAVVQSIYHAGCRKRLMHQWVTGIYLHFDMSYRLWMLEFPTYTKELTLAKAVSYG